MKRLALALALTLLIRALPAHAADTVTHGHGPSSTIFKDAASGAYWDAMVCEATDGSNHITPAATAANQAAEVADLDQIVTNTASGATHAPFATNEILYSSTTVSTSSYTTVFASTAQSASQIQVCDSSGVSLYLSYAASCGTLSSSTTTVLIPPNGCGGVPFPAPSSSCIGLKAKTTATSGSGQFDITLFH